MSMIMQYSNESLDRIQKIKKLQNSWLIVYANKYNKTYDISYIKENENTFWVGEAKDLMQRWAKNNIKTAGRMIAYHSHGKLAFAKIQDNTSTIQVCFVKDQVKFNTWESIVENFEVEWEEKTAYKIAEKLVDTWDYIWVEWELFYTNHGELTIFLNNFQILSKSIRPLPEKWHWIKDEELIYRQRYLDLIANDDSYEKFIFRSNFIKALRDFYHEKWFIELETPVMWNAASGAAAKPFITYHNDFDQEFYLRISPETSLKKATVGRFEKVFEIWKQFRNEWSDPSHIQEFTSLEHYAVYWNFEDNMKFTEELFDYLFEQLNLPKQIEIKDKSWQPQKVDFSTPWERVDYIQWIKNACGIQISNYQQGDEEKLREDIKKAGVEFAGMDEMWLATLIDYLYKKVLRPSIVWPAFVYNYPKTMQPLARTSDNDSKKVEQFQLVINGWEVVKSYSELVDPIEQANNFEEQAKAAAKWDEEATASDDEFVLAMEYWMPPQSGWGMWIDRILGLILWEDNIRDVVLFPLMKSYGEDSQQKE